MHTYTRALTSIGNDVCIYNIMFTYNVLNARLTREPYYMVIVIGNLNVHEFTNSPATRSFSLASATFCCALCRASSATAEFLAATASASCASWRHLQRTKNYINFPDARRVLELVSYKDRNHALFSPYIALYACKLHGATRGPGTIWACIRLIHLTLAL